jgi:hypothetical protein
MKMDQSLISQHISGGYFLAKYLKRPDSMPADLLPDRILSASNCIADIPDAWAVKWANYKESDRREEAAKFGITPEILPQVIEWVTSGLESQLIGWPVVFYSLETARKFAQRFLPNDSDLALIGIGLLPQLATLLLREEKPPDNHGTPGIYEAIGQGISLEPGGEVLGFEVLGYEWGGFHSWLCNGLEVDSYREFNVRPNSHGFISDLEDACKSAQYASREEVGAEPALWQPWLVVKYPKKS